MKLNGFWCAQSSSVKSQKTDCKFEQQQTRIQQNRLLTQCCLLGPANVYYLKAGKICIWGCTPSCWGQSPVWVLSNSNRLSRFSDFTPRSLGLSTGAFRVWFLCASIGQRRFRALNSSAEQQLLPAAFPFVKQWITVQTFAGYVALSSLCNFPNLLLSWNAVIRGCFLLVQ